MRGLYTYSMKYPKLLPPLLLSLFPPPSSSSSSSSSSPSSPQVSDGGVHSHISHLEVLLEAAKQAGVPQSFVHFFSDGRDTSPVSGGVCVCVCVWEGGGRGM